MNTAVDIPLNKISSIGISYDDGDVSNNPTIYVNGSPRTIENGLLTETLTPVGTRNSDATEIFLIGNNEYAITNTISIVITVITNRYAGLYPNKTLTNKGNGKAIRELNVPFTPQA